MQLFKRVLLPFLWGKGTFSVPSLGETGEGFHNVELCVFGITDPCCCFEITDPLYLPLKRGGPVCPHLECPVGGCNTRKNSKRRMYNIVFLYNYAVHLLYGKS